MKKDDYRFENLDGLTAGLHYVTGMLHVRHARD